MFFANSPIRAGLSIPTPDALSNWPEIFELVEMNDRFYTLVTILADCAERLQVLGPRAEAAWNAKPEMSDQNESLSVIFKGVFSSNNEQSGSTDLSWLPRNLSEVYDDLLNENDETAARNCAILSGHLNYIITNLAAISRALHAANKGLHGFFHEKWCDEIYEYVDTCFQQELAWNEITFLVLQAVEAQSMTFLYLISQCEMLCTLAENPGEFPRLEVS